MPVHRFIGDGSKSPLHPDTEAKKTPKMRVRGQICHTKESDNAEQIPAPRVFSEAYKSVNSKSVSPEKKPIQKPRPSNEMA